jgi:hypothetical protein
LKIQHALFAALCPLLFSTTSFAFSSGLAGASGKGGRATCTSCHGGGGGTPTVVVTGLESELAKGASVDISLAFTKATGSVVGFDAAVDGGGTLAIGDGETGIRVSGSEIIHSTPRPYDADVATFNIKLENALGGAHKLFIAWNDANDDGRDSGDSIGTAVIDFTVAEGEEEPTEGEDEGEVEGEGEEPEVGCFGNQVAHDGRAPLSLAGVVVLLGLVRRRRNA